ncbi:MAG: MBL fold metallo-hydrolase [Ferruginibacter sp.]
MSLYITSLNSGSNGNCYYIGNDTDAVLVDAGLSCRETERRMQRLELCMKKLRAIFVSHEHTDHVRGLAGLAGKYALPVYVTDATRAGCYHLKPESAVGFRTQVPVTIGSLTVTPFRKFHDAADPHSFIISSAGITIGVFTDLGRPCEELTRHFKKCHAAFLESNYDETMLENGRYPLFLKNRIRGGLGHLSNKQALDVFLAHRSPFMSHLLLAHLSADNNCPELVQKLFSDHAGKINVSVASRYMESPVYTLSVSPAAASRVLPPRAVQAVLF